MVCDLKDNTLLDDFTAKRLNYMGVDPPLTLGSMG